jgi:PAS domain S-box-containing protein
MTAGPSDSALFRSLFASLSDAIVIVDRGGRVVAVNAAFTAMFGYPNDAVAGATGGLLFARDHEFGA